MAQGASASPPASPPVSTLAEVPRGNRDGARREPAGSNLARPQVKPFKFTPLEW